MQDVICTLVMWLNTCVRFRRAECQLFNVQLQKCFADNETSPDFLSLKDWIFRAHFRASLNWVCLVPYLLLFRFWLQSWMNDSCFVFFWLQSVWRQHSGTGLRRRSVSLAHRLSGDGANLSLGALWTSDESEIVGGNWASFPSVRGTQAGLWQLLFFWLLHSLIIFTFSHPESCLPRCRTCDAAVRVLRKRSQQQVGEGRHGGAFPPEHRHKWLPAVRGGVLFSTSWKFTKEHTDKDKHTRTWCND